MLSDWDGSQVPFPGDMYSGDLQVARKRSNPDMRRSTLDKNFMRFGRSGFFPNDRCCKHRDLVGFSGSWQNAEDPVVMSKRGTDGNFMRFGRGDKDNFMRFGRGDKENFMRFGRGNENFMRFDRDKENFIRFGRGDKDNFMRFGKSDGNFMRFGRGQDNFMRFGRGDKENFIRFGRGDKDNFMRFGKSDVVADDLEPENFFRLIKSDNFMRFGKSSKTTSDGTARVVKSNKNGTNFLRFGEDGTGDLDKIEENEETGPMDGSEDPIKGTPTNRRKRMATDAASARLTRSPEIVEEVSVDDKIFKRSAEEYLSKPNLLKFISFINTNHPDRAVTMENARYDLVAPENKKYKRKQAGFIRFG